MFGRLLKIGSFFQEETGGKEDVEQDALLGMNLVARCQSASTAQAEFVRNGNHEDLGVEAFAMQPGDMEVAVPETWKAGDKVSAQGPQGRILLELPEHSEPGATLRCRLRPAPELRIRVPPGAVPGNMLTFERPDGKRIGITVPPGKQPGEHFEVTPPALMVLLPEGVQPGDTVVFSTQAQGQAQKQWLRAQVPEELQLGRFFAARLPPPEQAQQPKDLHTAADKGDAAAALLPKEHDGAAEMLIVEQSTTDSE